MGANLGPLNGSNPNHVAAFFSKLTNLNFDIELTCHDKKFFWVITLTTELICHIWNHSIDKFFDVIQILRWLGEHWCNPIGIGPQGPSQSIFKVFGKIFDVHRSFVYLSSSNLNLTCTCLMCFRPSCHLVWLLLWIYYVFYFFSTAAFQSWGQSYKNVHLINHLQNYLK